MWADLLQDMASALRFAMPEVTVNTHVDAQVPDAESGDWVRVLRGASTGRPYYGRPSGVQEINLELWVTRSEDEADADRRLMALEEQTFKALAGLPRSGDRIFNIEFLGIDPDGDMFRPVVGSRIRLKVHWRATTAGRC